LGISYGWTIIRDVPFRSKFGVTSLCLLFGVLSVQRAGAQSAQDRHDQIRASVESGNLSAAISQLGSVHLASASTFALNNYDYLLARLAERRRDVAVSSSNYQSVVARHSLLSQYALWHLAQIARSTGDLVLERERLRQLITSAPESLLREAAIVRLAQSFFESGDYAAVVSTLQPLSEAKNTGVARQALVMIGQAYLRRDKTTEARDAFTRLVAQIPDASRPDDFALAAARGLDQLDARNSATQTKKPLSEADHLLRASIYNFNRDFDGARTHYLALAESYEQSSSVADALFQIGRGYYQQGKYDDASKYFQRLQDRYATSTSARDALALIAATYNRLKRSDEAIAAYKLLIERFANAPNPERPYLNIIDTLRDSGRDDEALDWVKQTRARFKDQIGGTLALFAQAKIHLARGSWAATISDLDELQQAKDIDRARIPGGTTASEVAFLRAFALDQLNRTEEAIDAYLLIPEGRGEYYGFRANERLRALDSNPNTHPAIAAKAEALQSAARQAIESGQADVARRAAQNSLRVTFDSEKRNELLGIARRAYSSLPNYNVARLQLLPLGRREVLAGPVQIGTASLHQPVADELFFLGLYDEGVPELTAARQLESAGAEEQKRETAAGQSKSANAATKELSPANDLDYSIALYSLRGGLTNQAVRFAERIWKPIASDYLMELAPRDMTELLYPAPFRESLLKHAVPRGIDPRFLLAIARQESRFKSDAKSNAAARGLMQFISATADDVAKQLGKRAFSQDDLYNPDTAIEFGAQYLSSLFKQFPAMPQAVAGSYNGGPDNLARWIARSRVSDPDRYVAEIGFSQTKEYVFIVISNFWVYQQLYSEQLQRK
jgi:soluble lytic murein transglycosylase